jgi:hypothetical protein
MRLPVLLDSVAAAALIMTLLYYVSSCILLFYSREVGKGPLQLVVDAFSNRADIRLLSTGAFMLEQLPRKLGSELEAEAEDVLKVW